MMVAGDLGQASEIGRNDGHAGSDNRDPALRWSPAPQLRVQHCGRPGDARTDGDADPVPRPARLLI